ncbi:hypothetical protein [Streptomyces sp. NPDC001307]|uniref:hypothetical protein n=1 Tax=Streptomyces sp. NPDC001307 TaxID=3364560 RepID=UPI0036A5101D
MGELMGKLRNLDQMVARSVQALTSENITLKRCFQQLTREHRTLRERLEGARWNLRFVDKRIADPDAQILERLLTTPPDTTEVTSEVARRCPVCETVFTVGTATSRQVFCSPTCKETNRQSKPPPTDLPGLPDRIHHHGRPTPDLPLILASAPAFTPGVKDISELL